jgi:hypothetical protein
MMLPAKVFLLCFICIFKFRKFGAVFPVDSAVGIRTGYGQNVRGVGVRVAVRARFFSSHVVQTFSGAHPVSYPMGTGDLSPRVKRPGREADHSPPIVPRPRICGSIPSLLRTSSWLSA